MESGGSVSNGIKPQWSLDHRLEEERRNLQSGVWWEGIQQWDGASGAWGGWTVIIKASRDEGIMLRCGGLKSIKG